MPDPVLPLGGASFTGAATVREIGPFGMIALRARADLPGLASAIGPVPGLRGITGSAARLTAWMSPDEYLLLLPPAEVGPTLATIASALAGQHHLAADVSDARATLRVEGASASDVIARLCPVDLDRLPPGEMRRTRAAQVACALWRDGDGFNLIVFRSVARYAFELLSNAAR